MPNLGKKQTHSSPLVSPAQPRWMRAMVCAPTRHMSTSHFSGQMYSIQASGAPGGQRKQAGQQRFHDNSDFDIFDICCCMLVGIASYDHNEPAWLFSWTICKSSKRNVDIVFTEIINFFNVKKNASYLLGYFSIVFCTKWLTNEDVWFLTNMCGDKISVTKDQKAD